MAGRDERHRIRTEGGANLGHNPFAALSGHGTESGIPAPASGRPGPAASASRREESNRSRGRVEVRRMTAGRGGKTVTVVSGFVGIGAPEKEQLAKRMRAVCGCGGTVKEGRIEIQGDNREKVAGILVDAGFRPVMAGG